MATTGKERQRGPQEGAPTHECNGHDHDPIPTLLAPVPVPVTGIARAVEDGGLHDELGGTAVEDGVDRAIRRRVGRGAALAPQVAGDLGAKLGADLSGVRVHADSESHTLARSVQAEAFTVGSDIFFSRGSYSPGTSKGRSLLAHELTHVRQHQRGGSSGGSGLTVGRADDPTEREAETVSRQVMSGGPVSGAGPVGAPAVRRSVSRSAPATIRRLKASATPALGGSALGETLSAGADLANTLHAASMAKGGDNHGKYDGSALDGITSFGEVTAVKGVATGVGALYAGKQAIEGGIGVYDGVRQLAHKHDFGLASQHSQFSSIDRNAGAKKIEAGSLGLLGGAGGGLSAAGSIASMAGSNVPFADVVVNGVQAGVKSKAAVEDSIASARLGHQRTKVKRDQDMLMDDASRGQRFKLFLESLRSSDGKVKSADRTRWKVFYDAWLAHAATLNPAAPAAAVYLTSDSDDTLATRNKKSFFSRFKRGGGAAPAPATPATPTPATPVAPAPAPGGPWDPLTADWGTPTSDAPQKKVFLEFMKTEAGKDFGFGTGVREAYETKVRTDRETAESQAGGNRVAASTYEQMRGLGKIAAFGQRRKAETATINAVEATGHALDAAGTFTAGGDMGATKAVGKGIGLASGAYKGIKTLVKRGRRVAKLAEAKNAAEYGGKSDRGIGWKMKTFFGGNIEASQKKTRTALSGAADNASTFATRHAAWAVKKQAFDDRVQWLQGLEAAKTNPPTGTTPADSVTAYKTANPEKPDAKDPGPAPEQDRGGQLDADGKVVGKTATTKLSEQDYDKQIKLLTNQLKRNIDELIAAVFSDDKLVRDRARHIIHAIAESSLVGAIVQISDKELDLLYEVSQKVKADKTSATSDFRKGGVHALEFKRRKSTLRDLLMKQLEGVGG